MALKTTDEAIAGLPLFAAARDAGHRAGGACAGKAARETGFDAELARDAILEALRTAGSAMTGEELVDHCQRMGLVPHDARAFGPVFSALKKGGLIVDVGFAARRKGHGTAGARLWKATGGVT